MNGELGDDRLAAIVRRAMTLAATRWGPGGIEVTGTGELATAMRGALDAAAAAGPAAGVGDAAPSCIIDTTGRPEVIAEALASLAELGVLVLAGTPRPLTLDLYPDLHVRGLRIAGVAAGATSVGDVRPRL